MRKPSLSLQEAVLRERYRQIRTGAKARGLQMKLSIDMVAELIFSPCYYCGVIGKSFTSVGKRGMYCNGIDRVDNSKGYIKSNVVSCCVECNKAKGTKTRDEFLDLIKRIYAHQGFKDRDAEDLLYEMEECGWNEESRY